jgi:hypothetical protein
MREVSVRQLWGRAWDLFKVNWLLLVGLSVIAIIVTLISLISALLAEVLLWLALIGALIAGILLWSALVRAGYLVARQGQPSFGEVFRDISLLLNVFVYYLIVRLIPVILIGYGYMLVRAALDEALREVAYGGMRGSMVSTGTGDTLVLVVYILLFILYLFGWAGPYAILSGRAGIFDAIGQSFSLTAQNFGKVFLALLSYIGLLIFVPISVLVVSLEGFDSVWTLVGYLMWILMWYLIVLPMGSVFLPLLYLALTGEEGASHA